MTNLIQKAKDELHELILSAVGRAAANGALPSEPMNSFNIEVPADVSHGDLATNAAMVNAKAFKMPPRAIAEAVCAEIVLDGTMFERFEIAGPGFINFFFSHKYFENAVIAVNREKDDYGKTDYGKGKSVLVEFVSANPTGPMHIGNARGGAIGDSLASILDWAGYRVEREFYVNDAGNQIQKFALSLEIRYLQHFGKDAELPEDSYHGADIVRHAENFAEIYGDKYVDSTSEERRAALVEFALPKNIAGLKTDLEKYRINYDTWFLESSLHKSGAVDKVIKLFKENGATYEKDGALWFKATDFGAEQDFVLLRSNGIPTYIVPDIAYHYNKLAERNFDKAIDVLGADHHGYVPRLKSALKALGIDPNRLDALLMQMVRLVRDGEVIKASKRSGKAITLVTLLDEVPIDAARFFFNTREANSHFDFDLDLAVEKSSENPVYYVQYAHARICSILKSLADDGITPENSSELTLPRLTAGEEIELIRHLASFPNVIEEAAKSYDAARITRYSIELATKFHKFYNACRVRCDESELMQARLLLCSAVKTVLKNALSILKITAPESM